MQQASSHNMYIPEGNNVISMYCNGDYEKCPYYNKYIQEDKDMEEQKISSLLPEGEFNEMVKAEEGHVASPEFIKAYKVHLDIKQSAEAAATALTEMCKSLKQMRDEKLYTQLGFNSFDTYVENNGDYSFKARQAYTYISTYEKLGPQVLQTNASAGITKLSLLTDLPAYEREEFTEKHDLESESVSQLKAEIDELKPRAEQCSLFEIAKEEAEKKADEAADELDRIKKELNAEKAQSHSYLEDLNETLDELNELKLKPVEVAVQQPSEEDIEKIRQEERTKIEAESKEAVASAVKRANAAEQALKEEQEKKAELEKKLKAGTPDEAKAAFKFYFSNIQDNFSKFLDLIDKTEDEELKAKFKGAVLKYLDAVKTGISDNEEETN